jgi:hypothetical protein
MEAEASREIAAAIDRKVEHLDVSDVVAISSLSRGGDILFQEHAATRHLASYIVLPFEPQAFVKKSVSGVPTGDWEARFWRIWNRTPSEHREILKRAVNKNPYEACNQRQLEIAQQRSDEITLVALFDGSADGAGGTCDLIQRVRRAGGDIYIIDAKQLLAR